MTTKMTERDKKLLAGLIVFCVAALFILLVLVPLYMANSDMKEQIENNEVQIAQMQEKEQSLPAAVSENEARRQKLDEVQSDLYPQLKSQEIDRLLTEQVKDHGLEAKKLQIVMPQESANVAGFGRENDDGSNPDGKDGVWIAEVTMEVSGSMQDMDNLIDELALYMPGVRIKGLDWSSGRRQADEQTGMTEKYDSLDLQLEVLMGGKE